MHNYGSQIFFLKATKTTIFPHTAELTGFPYCPDCWVGPDCSHPTAVGCWHGQLPMENSQGMTRICHPQHQEISWTDAGHKFSFGTNLGFNNTETNSASPSLVSTSLCSCVHSQPETCPALWDPTSTKGFHSNAKLLYLLVIVVDVLGLSHTLGERFVKIRRIREAPSDHISNISSVNSAHSNLAFSTTLPHVFWKYQHQLCINSTSTCNFLKEERVKAYLNPWWHERSLNPNFKLQETHSQCKILGKSI